MKMLGRLITALITPFEDGGKVDYANARKLALALLDSGSDGFVVSGTTGEGSTLNQVEKLQLFQEIKSAIGNKGTVIAATGNYNTAESVQLSREAEKTGVDGLLLVVPYYNKPTQDGLYEHFKTIAGATKLPCILYNVPSRTITNLDADTVIKLSQIDNIVGIKEASANYEQISRIIDGSKKSFLVYSGNDSDTFPLMAMGGYGVISVISHIVGLQLKQLINLCINGQMNEAAKIHHKLLPLVNAMFVVANPMPLKYALNYLGFNVGKPRLPLLEPEEKLKIIIKNTLKNYKIDTPIPKNI
jgi:4-hydroxy-tetrahydrodipicolinate synthase